MSSINGDDKNKNSVDLESVENRNEENLRLNEVSVERKEQMSRGKFSPSTVSSKSCCLHSRSNESSPSHCQKKISKNIVKIGSSWLTTMSFERMCNNGVGGYDESNNKQFNSNEVQMNVDKLDTECHEQFSHDLSSENSYDDSENELEGSYYCDDQQQVFDEEFKALEDSDDVSSIDDYVENEEDSKRVKHLDTLIESLNDKKFDVIIPNSYVDEVTTVPNVRVLKSNDHIVSLQTIIRNKDTPRDEFIFNADRLIRIVIEEGLNLLPYTTRTVDTPTGDKYDGVQFLKMNCGVSIVRSGEVMEKALRECCRSIRIGKILIQSDYTTHQAHVLYSKFPADLQLRKVLLLYPIMGTGNTVIRAVKTLLKHGCKQSNIILINLFSTPNAIRSVCSRYHEMILLTTEVHPIVPYHFGKKYFGTD